MNETDAMRLLADANPIQADHLADLGRPDLRRPHQRGFVLAAVAAAAVAGAALVGVILFQGGTKPPPQPPWGAGIPPAHQPLADASTILGAPVVLPDTALVTPSDADRTVETACVPENDTVDPQAGFCQVRVSFSSLGLAITYLRSPATESLQTAFDQIAPQNPDARLLDLAGGVQALWVPQQYPWIEFELGGTQVSVEGNYDEATLQSIAQSIVDRSK